MPFQAWMAPEETLNALTPEKQRTIAEETLHVFVPLANRLGVWSIKAELEDGRTVVVNTFLIRSVTSASSEFWARYEALTPTAPDGIRVPKPSQGYAEFDFTHLINEL